MRISVLFSLIFITIGCNASLIPCTENMEKTPGHEKAATKGNINNKILNIYPNIIEVSAGPTVWDSGTETGRYFRLLVISFELEAILYVETIITDSEGINRKVGALYRVSSEYFKHVPVYHQINQIHIEKWSSFDTVRIKVDGVCYQLLLSKNIEEFKVHPCN